MAIRLIVDSASDITHEEAEKLGIGFIPLSVTFGDETYRDGIDLNRDQFYEKLVSNPNHPVTSQPMPKDVLDQYNKVMDAGDEAIVITMTGQMSGTYQQCKLLADQYEGRIRVIDSTNLSIGEKLLALEALRAIQDGLSLNEVEAAVKEKIPHVFLYGYLDTLEYLKRGGRISKTLSLLASLLSVKPIVIVKDGKIEMMDKARGRKKAFEKFATRLVSQPGVPQESYAVAYSGLTDQVLKEFVEQSGLVFQEDCITRFGTTIGTHAGADAIGIAFFADPADMFQ